VARSAPASASPVPLFTVETAGVRLAWRGPEAPPDPTAPAGVLRVCAPSPVRVTAAGAEAVGSDVSLPLRLAEETAYRVLLQSRTGAPVTLRHPDPNLTAGLTAEDGRRLLYGEVNFRGQIGASGFAVEEGGREAFALTVEVFPTKVALADVERMREEVDDALAGLALEYLRATHAPAVLSHANPSPAAWLTLLRRALPPLEAALAEVERHPARDLRRTPEPTRIERVLRPDAALRRAVRTGQGMGEAVPLAEGVAARSVLPAAPARATLDTPEHRWLAGRLDAARAALDALARAEAALPATPRRQRVRADLRDAADRVRRLRSLSFLQGLPDGPPPEPTPRLLTAPTYADAHAALRQLDLGLALAGGPVPHATRDLPLLYEMWAYLAVVRAVAERLGVEPSPAAFFRADRQGVRLALRRGRRHAVAFSAPGRRVTLAYTPRLDAPGALLAQRPDLLLTVEAPGRPPRWLVLDAKYRRDDGARYCKRFGAAGPPEEALGALHRYRDAIRPGPGVEGAVALYPHRAGPPFAASRLWRTVEGIGVGAVPLLPGHTEWLGRWLDGVLT